MKKVSNYGRGGEVVSLRLPRAYLVAAADFVKQSTKKTVSPGIAVRKLAIAAIERLIEENAVPERTDEELQIYFQREKKIKLDFHLEEAKKRIKKQGIKTAQDEAESDEEELQNVLNELLRTPLTPVDRPLHTPMNLSSTVELHDNEDEPDDEETEENPFIDLYNLDYIPWEVLRESTFTNGMFWTDLRKQEDNKQSNLLRRCAGIICMSVPEEHWNTGSVHSAINSLYEQHTFALEVYDLP